MQKENPTRSSTTLIDAPIELVWSVITDPNNFDALFIPNLICVTFNPIDHETAGPGLIIEPKDKYPDGRYMNGHPLHVVEWVKQTAFSFGYEPNKWTFRFVLREAQQGTEVVFERRFRATSWFESAAEAVFSKRANLQELADTTTTRLRGMCASKAKESIHV